MNAESLNKRGDTLQYSENTVALAEKAALQMLADGDQSVKQVSFGPMPESASFWIALDPEKIVSPAEILVEGVSFYFGLFRKEQR